MFSLVSALFPWLFSAPSTDYDYDYDTMTYDYDVINAQPTISLAIIEICKHHNLSNVNLGKYVANPKKYRTFIMKHHDCSKDAAKQLLSSLSHKRQRR